MRTLRLAPIAAACLLALPHSAVASNPPEHSGLECGIVYSQPDENSHEQEGYLFGGPLVVTVNGVLVEADVVCTLQIDNPNHGAVPSSGQAQGSGLGLVVVPPTGVTFSLYPSMQPYVCTEIWVAGTPFRVDNDPTTSGDQCNDTGSVTTGGSPYVRTHTLWFKRCVTVHITGQPKTVCVG